MNQDSIDKAGDKAGKILSRQHGSLGVITLDRPKALNALSLEMIRQIAVTLKRWGSDDEIAAVAFVGAGDRAFCAGGDLKSFYSSGMEYRRGHVNLGVPSLYFAEEYSLNKQIFDYAKPTIAFMDGITMGGGYGIAGHCQHRFVTQNTVFAMPEVGIGFFPDVGSVYHLLRAPNNWGRYLGMTGAQIGAGDVLAAGLADYYVESDRIGALIEAIGARGVGDALDDVGGKPDAVVFADHGEIINDVFAGSDVLAMCSKLRKADSVWATEMFGVILSRAPLSLMVTARHFEDMKDAQFDRVIAADYTLAQNFIAYPDLYEGIRAALIDRDRNPVWEPETLDVVKAEEVDRYFKVCDSRFSDIQIFS